MHIAPFQLRALNITKGHVHSVSGATLPKYLAGPQALSSGFVFWLF